MLLSGLLRTYNEQENLPKSLDNLFSFCDEVVISDGGSTDNTRKIAQAYQDAGYPITWLDFYEETPVSEKVHFNHAGKQLNFGLAHCKGEWVITNDTDIVHCERLRAHLRRELETDRDAFLMYGVHLIGDWGHYAENMGTGPGLVQLFRNKAGVQFPDQPEHAAHTSNFPWDNLGIIMGGIFHWGYVDKEVELAKIQLRSTAVPNDATYAHLANNPPEYTLGTIPWICCHANCVVCWMEQIAVKRMVGDVIVRQAECTYALSEQEKNLNAALLVNNCDYIEMQTKIYGEMRESLAVTTRMAEAVKARAKELDNVAS